MSRHVNGRRSSCCLRICWGQVWVCIQEIRLRECFLQTLGFACGLCRGCLGFMSSKDQPRRNPLEQWHKLARNASRCHPDHSFGRKTFGNQRFILETLRGKFSISISNFIWVLQVSSCMISFAFRVIFTWPTGKWLCRSAEWQHPKHKNTMTEASYADINQFAWSLRKDAAYFEANIFPKLDDVMRPSTG